VRDCAVGYLMQVEDYVFFEWDSQYWDDPHREILGLAFEDHPRMRVASNVRLPAWFSNLLPEGILREWIARHYGVNPAREMEILRQIGSDLPGAVRVYDLPDEPDSTGLSVTHPKTLLQERKQSVELGFRFSLAGVAPKFSMIARHDRLTMPGSDEEGDWIVKTPDARFPLVPINEFATMSFAQDVGIDVPEFRLVHRDDVPTLPASVWTSGEEFAFAIRRFDRTAGGRVHMEDLAQVRSLYPEQKYTGSFETVCALVFRGHDRESFRRILRRIVFSFLVGNGDMHLKNISLLYVDPARPTLSPAYDLVSTIPYLSDLGLPHDLGLKIGGSRLRKRLRRESFSTLAQIAGDNGDAAYSWIEEDVQRIMDASPDALSRYQSLERQSKWIASNLPTIAHQLLSTKSSA